MTQHDRLPTIIESGDSRIGRKVRCTDNGFTGIVEYILRYADGFEYYSIRDGAGARNGVEPELVVFEEE